MDVVGSLFTTLCISLAINVGLVENVLMKV